MSNHWFEIRRGVPYTVKRCISDRNRVPGSIFEARVADKIPKAERGKTMRQTASSKPAAIFLTSCVRPTTWFFAKMYSPFPVESNTYRLGRRAAGFTRHAAVHQARQVNQTRKQLKSIGADERT